MASLTGVLFIASFHFFISSYDFQEFQFDYSPMKATSLRRWRRETGTSMFDLEGHVYKKLERKYKSQDKNIVAVFVSKAAPAEAGDLANSKLSASVRNIQKGKEHPPVEKFSGLFSNLYCNSQQLPLTSTINQLIKRNATFTYRASRGLKRFGDNNITIELSLPPGLQKPGKEVSNLKINILDKKSDAETVTDEQPFTKAVTVGPQSAKAVNITVVYKEITMDYTAEIVMSGNVVAKYKDEDGKEKFEAHPISKFYDSNFEAEGNNLIFKTSGTFKGSRFFDVKATESDVPITTPQCQHEELQSDGGVKIIHMNLPENKEEDLTSK